MKKFGSLSQLYFLTNVSTQVPLDENNSSTTSSQLTASPTRGCKDCDNHTTGVPAEIPTGCSKTSDSSNFQLPFIIVCVILLIVILLVLIFRLYRRRALCFGKMKKQKKTDNNLHGELQDVENNEEPIYEEADLSQLKNEIEPYEEVHCSPPSLYAELSREQEDGTADYNYQKLLKNDLDYVISAEDDVESPYEETSHTKSPPGYTELDNTTREPDDDASYQGLIKL